jgi:hypothetical protein
MMKAKSLPMMTTTMLRRKNISVEKRNRILTMKNWRVKNQPRRRKKKEKKAPTTMMRF